MTETSSWKQKLLAGMAALALIGAAACARAAEPGPKADSKKADSKAAKEPPRKRRKTPRRKRTRAARPSR